MKIIFVLILLIAKGSSGQDLEARFNAFLNQTLSGLGDWIKENNLAPSPIPGTERFYFKGTDRSGKIQTELNGEMKDRFYHGAKENISLLRLSSDLTLLTFQMVFTHGSGSSDYITGEYSINGRLPSDSINISGMYTRSNQTTTRLYLELDRRLGVTPDGYFIIEGGPMSYNLPIFTNLQLEGMNEHYWEYAITPIVNSWYEMQHFERNDMQAHYNQYINEVFERTPIIDIIGVPLPPTMTSAEAENFKKAKMVRKSQPYFDGETQQVLQKQFI